MYMKKWHVTIFKFSVAFGKFTKIPPAKGLFHKKLHRPQKQNWLLITCKEIHNFDTILTQFCLIDYPIYGILHSEKSILLTHATWIMGKRRFLLKSSLVNFWFPGIFELRGVSHCVLCGKHTTVQCKASKSGFKQWISPLKMHAHCGGGRKVVGSSSGCTFCGLRKRKRAP